MSMDVYVHSGGVDYVLIKFSADDVCLRTILYAAVKKYSLFKQIIRLAVYTFYIHYFQCILLIGFNYQLMGFSSIFKMSTGVLHPG